MELSSTAQRKITIVLAIIFLSSLVYYIKSERKVAVANKELTTWMHDNNLKLYMKEFNAAECKSLNDVLHLDVTKSTNFKDIPMQKKKEIQQSVNKEKRKIALQIWLQTWSIPDMYFSRLLDNKVESLEQLQYISDEFLETLTMGDHSFYDYQRIKKAVRSLQREGNDWHLLENELLSHRKREVEPVTQSLLAGIVKIVGMIVLVTGVSIGIMIVTRQPNQIQPATLYHTGKKSFLNLFSGRYDITQYTTVTWDWEEPQVVGRTMTFSVKFLHKNGKPYPVSDADSITVEIMHNGVAVAKTMEIGSSAPDDVNLVKVAFTVHKSGEYIICVMCSSRHIKGSPFAKKFDAGPIDASKTGFVNYASTVVCTPDTAYPLVIEARDSFGNLAQYKTDQNNYFKIKVTESGTDDKYVPATQIFYNSAQKQLAMHIKMEKEGCFQATVSYGDIKLKNGDFNILVLSDDALICVDKSIKRNRNIWYEARLLECNHEKLSKPKKVFIYITPKQLKLKEYFLKIIGRRLYTYRVCPSTKFQFNGFNNQFGAPVFTIDDGAQAPVVLAAKERNIIAATFTKFLLRNIGGSETFQDKQSFFQHEVRTLHQRRSHTSLSIKIDRSRLLHSSLKATKNFDLSDWCKNFEVTFIGEEGLDWGGLRREWFELLCKELFDHNDSGLFKRLSEDSQGLVQPNRDRSPDCDVKMYEFAGKIVGKCLYESSLGGSYRQLVRARFSRSFLAQLIGLRVHYRYFETDDPDLYKSKIKYIEENDIDGMELTFSEEVYSDSGVLLKVVDLIPNGSKIPVTNENKLQYLDLLAQHRLANSVREEIDSFLKGLNELIPDNLLSIFDENELEECSGHSVFGLNVFGYWLDNFLSAGRPRFADIFFMRELLLCGTMKYSVADLKNNHTFAGSSPTFRRVLDWFWIIIDSFTDEQMARLIQFTTGCSQLPPGGFAELTPKFQISPSYTFNTLPTAHTCFNNLCLPDYDSIEQFHRSLLIAINEGNQGFGFV